MSTTYRPLPEQAANKMITDLKNGTSIFQMPNNSPNSALPFNIETGNRYPGPSALALLMQKRDDPRWATFNQANRNHTAVNKGATGTFINFMSQYEFQKVFKDGEPVLKENGKQRTEKVKLDAPIEVKAQLFNGEQLRKLPKWEKEPMLLEPAERAQLILDNSKAVIEHGGDDMLYDRQTDTIVLPELEQFANPEQYYAEALHQLAHWTAAPDRLNRLETDGLDGAVNIKEELRTNLASVFLSKELNLPYDLNYHVGYVNAWAQVLKDEPDELYKAAEDAQKIVDQILSFEQKIEVKQDLSKENGREQMGQTGEINEVIAEQPKFNTERLTKGEIIPHNGTEFKVLAELKNNVYNMQDLSDKRKFKMSSDSGLFTSLLEARNNTQEISTGIQADHEAPEIGENQEADNTYQIQR